MPFALALLTPVALTCVPLTPFACPQERVPEEPQPPPFVSQVPS